MFSHLSLIYHFNHPVYKPNLCPCLLSFCVCVCARTCACACRLAQADMQLLWDQRYYCHRYEHSLPKILASVSSWDWTSIPEIYKLLHSWPPLSPVYALELLDSKYVHLRGVTKCHLYLHMCLFSAQSIPITFLDLH